MSRSGWVAVALAALALVIAAATPRSAGAPLQGVIDRALSEGGTVVFSLAVPLIGGEALLTSDDYRISTGADYVCFGQPWNEGEVRQRCTPYSNIASVSFVERAR